MTISRNTTISNKYFYFEEGFPQNVKDIIINSKHEQKSMSCFDESEKWAEIIAQGRLDDIVDVVNGMYNDFGHTWVEVNGRKFDPTASQFEDFPDMLEYLYETHHTRTIEQPPPTKNKIKKRP